MTSSTAPWRQQDSGTALHDGEPPAWAVDQLPEPYQDVLRKIAELRAEARRYEDVTGILWRVGQPLADGLRDLFTALEYETSLHESETSWQLHVQIDTERRLLVQIAGAPDAVDRKSPAITDMMRLLQDTATDHDRLVLAVNAWCDTPLDKRREPLTPDALRVVHRLGGNVVSTATLFGIWKYSLTNRDEARKTVLKLYNQDGGVFK
jgi:hypothetical protein